MEAKRAMRQILDGLAFLHDRNIAHLDLKPQNLLLAEKDSCDDIKLCDFGISKVLEPGVTVREILGAKTFSYQNTVNVLALIDDDALILYFCFFL